MKKAILFFALALCISFTGFADFMKPDFKLHKVTVYLVGAELNYRTKVSLPKGRSTLAFGSISQNIKENSVRVKIDNNVKIISVSFEDVKIISYEKQIKMKQDSLEMIENMLSRLSMEMKSYRIEKQLLTDNITRIGSSQNVTTAELLSATKMFREKLNELDNIEFKFIKEEQRLSSVKADLQEGKAKLMADQSLSEKSAKVKQLIIEVETKSDAASQVDMTYLVSDAGWSPKYNVRALTDGTEIELEYRANVYNNSGINWKNVSVTLSTASTETKLIKPELGYAWSLDFNSNNQSNSKATGEGNLSNKQLKNDNVEFVSIEAPELDLYMNLDVDYDIPADNLPHMVSVGDFKLPSRYKYYAVPKVDDNVYLIAYINGWQKLNLIEGESSIYYNGAFLGNSFLDTKFSNTELEVSLGIEKGIQISKVKKEDKEAEKTIGTNRYTKLIYSIDVRNNKTKDIDIQITDQVPISQDSDIEIEVLNISDAKRDDETGKLTWNLTLKPNEFKKLLVEFSVKYPRNKARSMDIDFALFRFGRSKVICPKFR
jgi:uncharacterized protein (TIGR02231 family)